METALELVSISLDDVASVEVGAGCFRKDLPGPGGVRVWVVDYGSRQRVALRRRTRGDR